MFDEDFFKSLEGGHEDDDGDSEELKGLTPLPESRKEWMEREGIDTWPHTEVEDELFSDQSSQILGDLEDIKTDIMNHAPFEDRQLNDVDARLSELEEKLAILADRFLYGQQQGESASENGGLCIIKQPNDAIQAFCDPDLLTAMSEHKRKSNGNIADTTEESTDGSGTVLVDDKEKKLLDQEKLSHSSNRSPNTMEGISGDISKGLAPSLPNKLEPLPLLDAVTKQQGFKPKFCKIWKKFFCSEASCSILQCAFWWIWMEVFKPQEREQMRLYTIMAEKFSLLLLDYTSSHNKDELFQHYTKCLSQAVFAVFCHAFPKYVKRFRSDEFLHQLCDHIYEWTTGIPCPLGCWKDWSLIGLDPNYVITHAMAPKDKEESSIGPGPTFECVQFVTNSQCPLLHHHFLVHKIHEMPSSLTDTGGGGIVMSRTQIKKEAPPSMTFKELIEASKDLSRKRNEAYEKQMIVHQQQLSEVLAEHTTARLNMKRETKKLLSQKCEVAQRAEKIISRYIPAPKSNTHIAETVVDDEK